MLLIETIDGAKVATFNNLSRFNVLVTDTVKEKLKAVFNVPNTTLILDLQGITFIDSTGFGVFLSLMKTANNTTGHFRICNIGEEAMELFKLLQLHNVFEIFNTRQDALKSSR